jgi:hypothetical protein
VLKLVPVAPYLAHLGMDKSRPRIPAGLTVASLGALDSSRAGGFMAPVQVHTCRHWERNAPDGWMEEGGNA